MQSTQSSSTKPSRQPRAATDQLDLLITGGRVIDGTGRPAFDADIGVAGDRIVAISMRGDAPLPMSSATRCIDAIGLTVAPGFIDCHSHDDLAVLDGPDMTSKVSQGVTTVINGNCGVSLAPLHLPLNGACNGASLPSPLSLFPASGPRGGAFRFPDLRAYRTAFEAAPAAVNVAQLIGHGTLRVGAMTDVAREATDAEIAAMKAKIRESMEAGAIGLSAGLAYDSARCAATGELVELARAVADCGGLLTMHLRDEGQRVVESVAEAIHIGREAGLPIVLSHHKCVGRDAWGLTLSTLRLIAAARLTNEVGLDLYPYTATSTVLMMDRVESAERVVVTHSIPHPACAGCELADIASDWKLSIAATIERLSPAGAVYFNLHEDDLRRVLAFPGAMIGSDGLTPPTARAMPHPRLFGTFPRVLGHYSRELGLLSLEQAVHRMTGVPATVFGLPDRGVIRVGAHADITIFDAGTIIDRATFDDPTRLSAGIAAVFVNGRQTWAAPAPRAPPFSFGTSHRPGRWLQRRVRGSMNHTNS
ncbi:MAG: D-aminoacylase [Betaproteobacteria bacterium]